MNSTVRLVLHWKSVKTRTNSDNADKEQENNSNVGAIHHNESEKRRLSKRKNESQSPSTEDLRLAKVDADELH